MPCLDTYNYMDTGSALWISDMSPVKRIWYLSPMRAAKVQASLRIRAVSPEPSLLAYTSSESKGTFTQKARSQAPLNGWACAVKVCHDGMLEDTNSLDGAHMLWVISNIWMYFSSVSHGYSLNLNWRRTVLAEGDHFMILSWAVSENL